MITGLFVSRFQAFQLRTPQLLNVLYCFACEPMHLHREARASVSDTHRHRYSSPCNGTQPCSAEAETARRAARQNSFHGRTYGAMAITTSKTYYRQGFSPLMPSVTVAPYPYCLHCKARACARDGSDWYKACPRCWVQHKAGCSSGFSPLRPDRQAAVGSSGAW